MTENYHIKNYSEAQVLVCNDNATNLNFMSPRNLLTFLRNWHGKNYFENLEVLSKVVGTRYDLTNWQLKSSKIKLGTKIENNGTEK